MVQLRLLQNSDFTLMKEWLQRDYIREYCGDLDETLDEVLELMNSTWGEAYIIEYQNVPVGYIQCYDCHNEPSSFWKTHVENGAWGIDIWVGEKSYWGKGVAESAIKNMINILKEKRVTAIIIDPHKSNERAKRFYERIGFRFVKSLGDHPEGGNDLMQFAE